MNKFYVRVSFGIEYISTKFVYGNILHPISLSGNNFDENYFLHDFPETQPCKNNGK